MSTTPTVVLVHGAPADASGSVSPPGETQHSRLEDGQCR